MRSTACCMRLADTIEKQVELRRKVKSAMTYPVVVAILVLTDRHRDAAVRHPDVPERSTSSSAARCPVPTQILIDISNVVPQALVRRSSSSRSAAASGFRRWINSEEGRKQWDAIKLKMPIFGKLVRKTALARFSRTLSALVRSGVPILESLDIVAETAGNYVVAEGGARHAAAVKRGEPLSQNARGARGVPADGRADDGRR